jgi:tRNA-dihydrouridine synthase
MAEACGVNAIAVHPRTATQGFGGKADWSLIGKLKQSLSIPVIGNGDVLTAWDALRMQSVTACDAVMIGRASQGNPWIFSQTLDLMAGREPTVPGLSARLEVIVRYVNYMVDHFGEYRGVRMLRSRIVWFVKGMPGCSTFRNRVTRLTSRDEMIAAVRDYFDAVRHESEFTDPVKRETHGGTNEGASAD